jgi:hypothetical protein
MEPRDETRGRDEWKETRDEWRRVVIYSSWGESNNQDFQKLVLLQGLTSVVGVDFALDLFRKALWYVLEIVVDLC